MEVVGQGEAEMRCQDWGVDRESWGWGREREGDAGSVETAGSLFFLG